MFTGKGNHKEKPGSKVLQQRIKNLRKHSDSPICNNQITSASLRESKNKQHNPVTLRVHITRTLTVKVSSGGISVLAETVPTNTKVMKRKRRRGKVYRYKCTCLPRFQENTGSETTDRQIKIERNIQTHIHTAWKTGYETYTSKLEKEKKKKKPALPIPYCSVTLHKMLIISFDNLFFQRTRKCAELLFPLCGVQWEKGRGKES